MISKNTQNCLLFQFKNIHVTQKISGWTYDMVKNKKKIKNVQIISCKPWVKSCAIQEREFTRAKTLCITWEWCNTWVCNTWEALYMMALVDLIPSYEVIRLTCLIVSKLLILNLISSISHNYLILSIYDINRIILFRSWLRLGEKYCR